MMVQDALVSEYANGGGIEDVNMMAFALVDRIRFSDPKGLLREAQDYEGGDPAARVRDGQLRRRRRRPRPCTPRI